MDRSQRITNKRGRYTEEEFNTLKEWVSEAPENLPVIQIVEKGKELFPGRTASGLVNFYSRYIRAGYTYQSYIAQVSTKKRPKEIPTIPVEKDIVEVVGVESKTVSQEEKLKKRMDALVSVLSPQQKDELLKKMLME